MSSIEEYNSKLAIITAIPEKDIKIPTIPVKVYVQEAERLHTWCQDDKEALLTAKLNWDLADDIPVRAGALRHADALWYKNRFSQALAVKEWQMASDEGYELRNVLLHDFYHAYEDDTGLLGRVSGIAEGTGHADMIHDLHQMAVMGREYVAHLEAIGFDMAKLDKAAEFSDLLASMLARSEVDKDSSTRTLVIRNQAYTHLKQAVDAVRKKGQYVFWRDEARLKGYASDYLRKAASKSKNNEGPEEPDPNTLN